MPAILCTKCKFPYPEIGTPYICPQCGGMYDYDGPFNFSTADIDKKAPGIWKYRHSFGFSTITPEITLAEGNTPLLWQSWMGKPVGLKLESLNPTGSYKDRGTATAVSFLASRGVKQAIEDSSGNAGASFAAYAAAANINARVFVPDYASGPKKNQIEQYGAELVKIPGPRAAAAEAVLKEARLGIPYASHAFLPFGLPGIATIAYEIWEALGEAPGSIISPAGHGGLLLGIVRGFAALQKQGLIKTLPYYVGVQAANMAPLYTAFKNGMDAAEQIAEGKTIAEGVSVRRPSRMQALIQEIPAGRRDFLAIDEKDILPAYHQLAKTGIYVEPTSAIAWKAFQSLFGKIPEPIILILTGTGLKYQSS
jgi:threonine synthase